MYVFIAYQWSIYLCTVYWQFFTAIFTYQPNMYIKHHNTVFVLGYVNNLNGVNKLDLYSFLHEIIQFTVYAI